MENKILELEKKLQDMELKYNHLFEIVEELNYYFLKEVSEGGGDDVYYPTFIPRDNSKYLESGLNYSTKDYDEVYMSRLTEDNIKEDLRYSSRSELIKGIKEENVGRVAPKYLWSIYDKIEKLKSQEEKELVEERVKRFKEIANKIQGKKDDIEKKREKLREEIKEREVETAHMKRELNNYKEED